MSEYDPTETEDERAERLASTMQAIDPIELVTSDIVWLASGPRGRRIIRRSWRNAGIDIQAARIGSSRAPQGSHGQMCFEEGLRARAFGFLAHLLRALATGELRLESWQLLVTEKDDG